MMFFDCPAWLDKEGAIRCGLPAEVRCRFTMRSTDGFVESAMIRCPDGHWFNGPIESLTCEGRHTHDQGAAGAGTAARRDSLNGRRQLSRQTHLQLRHAAGGVVHFLHG